ncbi:Uncharacterized protein TPAR_04557 [Tolypocladium paradoxum]|uniref:Uncharacterized protein n=1 Tax=Tolypocladium paradoxum TaxID=94208 RepID=A0A2S4KYI0_9HYPO|nr:Uncharacterized protein TPAR_04557 [Tolypocladium paradoxum]
MPNTSPKFQPLQTDPLPSPQPSQPSQSVPSVPSVPPAGPLAPPPGLAAHPGVNHSVMLANDRGHYERGLEILLDYLNKGNTYDDLLRVQQAARNWCRGCYDTARVLCARPTTALDAHPDLFIFAALSWKRICPAGEIIPADGDEEDVADGTDGDSDGDSDDSETELFPAYEEHTLLEDWKIAEVVEWRDIRFWYNVRNGFVDLRDDRYSGMRGSPISGTDLLGSPILQFLPEVLMQMAFIDPRAIIPLNPAGAEW